MIAFPNAKINIGLNILDKRADGYHNLETVFFPIQLRDALEVVPTSESTHPVIFESYGRKIDGPNESNLCIRAYALLKKDFPSLPSIKIILYKNIPLGAGMGGGSADAAFTLKLLNDTFTLGIKTQQLLQYALQLGSDAPFFIINQPCIGEGRGEQLTPIDLKLNEYHFLIINPGIHIHTGKAFSMLPPNRKHMPVSEWIQTPIQEWKELVTNDFEIPVFEMFPEIRSIKETLYEHGAVYASLSGSGSTVYGIFKNKQVTDLNFPEHYFQKWV